MIFKFLYTSKYAKFCVSEFYISYIWNYKIVFTLNILAREWMLSWNRWQQWDQGTHIYPPIFQAKRQNRMKHNLYIRSKIAFEYNTFWLKYCYFHNQVIGNNNLIMGSCHIAHDCKVGNNNIFANNTLMAGHVIVEVNHNPFIVILWKLSLDAFVNYNTLNKQV